MTLRKASGRLGIRGNLGAALLLIATACVFLPRPCNGQSETASVNGTITDKSGAVIPGAVVVLRNNSTGGERNFTTNRVGNYVILGIPPGKYTLTVSKQGFSTYEQPDFNLFVNQTATFNITLTVGEALQTVAVTATGVRIESSTAELGTTFSQREVNDLPLNGRNFTELLTLAPGMSPVNVSQNGGGFGTNPIGTFSIPAVNGQRNRSDLFMLDGVYDLGAFTSTYGIAPIVDDIQEFKVESHNDEAEFGSALGGIVNVLTKGGTNQFHGAAWEFVRNDAFDARNFFISDVTPFKQNQFGAEIGGPVILPGYNGRNKTFFYAAYEGFRNHTTASSLYNVPTPSELAGDFSGLTTSGGSLIPIYNPFTTAPDPSTPGSFLRQPFANNQIPSNLINPTMQLFAKTLFPAPVNTGVAGFNGLDTDPIVVAQDEPTLRFDEQVGPHDSAFVRYTGVNQSNNHPNGYANLYQDTWTHESNLVASETHTFGGSAVMTLEFGRTRQEINFLGYFKNAPPNFALTAGFSPNYVSNFMNAQYVSIPNVSVSGYLGGGPCFNDVRATSIYEYKGDISKISGHHTIKAGADFASSGYGNICFSEYEGFCAFQTSNLEAASGGNSVASFLLGVPSSASRTNHTEAIHGGWVNGFYGQDQWKVSSRLTVNLGLRYDLTLQPALGSKSQGDIYSGDMNFNNGTYILAAVPPACSGATVAPCIPGGSLPAHVVVTPYSNGRIYHDTYGNLGPRIGLAYRLDNRTALRAAYGRFFDNWAGVTQTANNYAGTWPSLGYTQVVNANSTVPTVSALNPLNATANRLPGPTPFTQTTWFQDPLAKNPYADQWNFGVERQLGATTVLSANYVGSHGGRLDVGIFANTAPTPGPGNPQDRAPYPYITPTYYDSSIGRSSYNAFQFSLDRKASRGLTYLISYTYSKSMDIGASEYYNGASGIEDPYNLNADKSVSGYDLTHILSLSWVYQLPFGANQRWSVGNHALNYIVGNWQANGIASLTSGPPFDVGISGDIANTGNAGSNAYGYERLNYLGGPKIAANPTPSQWLNLSAFAVPAQYTFGNLGRNTLRADWTRSLDFSLFREFPISESKRLEFRVDSFNLFNTPIFGIPDTNYNDPTFGVINSANTPRQLQFALKFYF